MKKAFQTTVLIVLITIHLVAPISVSATGSENNTRHYLGSVVNAGHDTGYSESNKITEKDPHFGWTLGNFYVSGYTRLTEDKNGTPVFLKTVGDTVTLWFELKQDINKLNGNEMLSISADNNGYDEYFGIEKTEMGHGTLIVRHTDYQNHVGDPIIYTDYLSANISKDAAVEVKLCEEGDYEVALNYEIRKDNLDIFGWNPFPSYEDYRIFFRFSVRNGNCMVYPFDVGTGAELTNSSITGNGFYLDLAKSRYLNIDIKKEIRTDGADGLTEDVRFNKPAKDGEQYTDEGIYTITVSNLYTNQTTTKIIYVGTDDVLKAHVVTGLSITDVEYQLSLGATVADDGTIIPPTNNTLDSNSSETQSNNPTDAPNHSDYMWLIIVGSIIITALVVSIITYISKSNKRIRRFQVQADPEETYKNEGKNNE